MATKLGTLFSRKVGNKLISSNNGDARAMIYVIILIAVIFALAAFWFSKDSEKQVPQNKNILLAEKYQVKN